MRPNPNDIVLIPDDRKNSHVIQIPWLFTLSNTEKVKLSITNYDVFQMEDDCFTRFSNMVGLVKNFDGSRVVLSITLDAGESKTMKMHLGLS